MGEPMCGATGYFSGKTFYSELIPQTYCGIDVRGVYVLWLILGLFHIILGCLALRAEVKAFAGRELFFPVRHSFCLLSQSIAAIALAAQKLAGRPQDALIGVDIAVTVLWIWMALSAFSESLVISYRILDLATQCKFASGEQTMRTIRERVWIWVWVLFVIETVDQVGLIVVCYLPYDRSWKRRGIVMFTIGFSAIPAGLWHFLVTKYLLLAIKTVQTTTAGRSNRMKWFEDYKKRRPLMSLTMISILAVGIVCGFFEIVVTYFLPILMITSSCHGIRNLKKFRNPIRPFDLEAEYTNTHISQQSQLGQGKEKDESTLTL